MAVVQDAGFWLALVQIIGIGGVLAADNAVVIALLARELPPARRWAAVLGASVAAVGLRVAFCLAAMWLMPLAHVQLAGGVLLLWIGVQLMVPERGGRMFAAKTGIWAVLPATFGADAVMSLGNAVAIVAVARGDGVLIGLGVLVTVPVIMFGSLLVLRGLLRFPGLVTAGTGLLGWTGGGLILGDGAVRAWLPADAALLDGAGRLAAAVLAMGMGAALARRGARQPRDIVDLAPAERQ